MFNATGRASRITKRTVEMMDSGSLIWDEAVRGFGVRRQQRDPVYVLKTRVAGRQRWFTIGTHGAPWTPETARRKAVEMLGAIASGVDLAQVRETEKVAAPSFGDLARRYLSEHAREHKKASSAHTDARNIENHLLPFFGDMTAADITREDVDRFKRAVRDGLTAKKAKQREHRGGAIITGGKGVANRCLALLSKMMNLAEFWGIRPDNSNPVRHVTKYKEGRRERYLSTDEIGRLGDVIIRAERTRTESPFAIAALRLLILTGARLGEILNLEWEHVDQQRSLLDLPDSKSGRKQIFLSPPALKVLSELPRIEGNPYVIVGAVTGAHLVNLQKPWGRIRKAAGLEDVRIHDLRHSFASVAAASGLSLPVIGKLLGHTKSVTTERYAHLAADPLRAANDTVAARIAASMQPNGNQSEDGEIVELQR